MRVFVHLLLLFLLLSCSDTNLKKDLEVATTALAETEARLAAAQEALTKLKAEESGTFTHLVFFTLKPNVDVSLIVEKIRKIEAIEEVKDLELGPFKNVNDPRALSQYSFVFEMSFDDEKAYERYQVHPLHVQLKEKSNPFWPDHPLLLII